MKVAALGEFGVRSGVSLTAVTLMVAVSLAVRLPAAGIAVVVDRKRQRRAGAGVVGVVVVDHRRGDVGVEQRVDLSDRAADRHRRGAAIADSRAAAARGYRQDPFRHRQGHGLAARRAAVNVADRQSIVLEGEIDLLGRTVGRWRDGRDRRVIHRIDGLANGDRAGAVASCVARRSQIVRGAACDRPAAAVDQVYGERAGACR